MSEEREAERLTTAQSWLLGLLGGLVVLALMGAAYLIGFNRGEDEAATEPVSSAEETPTAPSEQSAAAQDPGEDLFVANCGSCHTLDAAGTSGATGPDLDTLAPAEDQVLAAIENGGAGSGAMPANLVTGEEAEQVAAYVSSSAG